MFKGRHFDRSVILLCVRWYLAYGLSLRDLEEMMDERNIHVDHSTVHRWILRFAPQLLERFNKRKRAVTGKWHIFPATAALEHCNSRCDVNLFNRTDLIDGNFSTEPAGSCHCI